MLDLRCYAGFKTWKERPRRVSALNRRHGHAAENSEVLLPGLVAVAVRDCRFTTLAGNATVKLALPAVKPARPLPQPALSQLSSTLSILWKRKKRINKASSLTRGGFFGCRCPRPTCENSANTRKISQFARFLKLTLDKVELRACFKIVVADVRRL